MHLLKKFFLVFLVFAYSYAENCNCRLRTNNRIVNGEFSSEHSIPWLISLAINDFHICGGSIINEKLILTAAHCIDGKKAEELNVRIGIHNVKTMIPENKVYKVANIISHEYKGIEVPGDIAILELVKEIEFIEGQVEKACFNLDKKTYSNQLLAAGWGMTDLSYLDPKTKGMVLRGKPDNLKHAFFQQVINYCESYLICLKPVVNGDSICQGDSGGPLHYTEKGMTTVEGVASFVDGTENNDVTLFCVGGASYSRLSYYADWFKKIVGDNFCKIKKPKFFGLF